jgi:hypothetical protein
MVQDRQRDCGRRELKAKEGRMTSTTNARTAGIAFIVYFAAVMAQVAGARDLAASSTLIGQFSALVLGVTRC